MRNIYNSLIVILVMLPKPTLAKEIKYRVSDIPKELKENARSVVRNEEIEFEITSTSSAVKRVTYAITILNINGVEDADFIQFYDKFSHISDISAKLYDQNGEFLRRIPADKIIDHSAIIGYTIYDDNRVKFIDPGNRTFPFTVEYNYEISYRGLMNYPGWQPYTDYNMAIEKSTFKVLTPKSNPLRYIEKNLSSIVTQSSDKKNNVYYWEAKNCKALLKEPFCSDLWEFIPNVIIAPSDFEIDNYKGNMVSWKNFGSWIDKLNENKNDLPVETKKKLNALIANAHNDFEKVQKLYEYMQDKTRYVSIQIGIGGWQPFDAETVDRLSYGDCKALANYMMSLLKAVGIKANYSLVNAGTSAPLMIKEFPCSQFNHAFLCVPLKNDTLWLECTSQRVPCGYIGNFTDDRDVLLIDKDSSKIVHTKTYGAEDNKKTRISHVKLNNTGGSANIFAVYKGINYDKMLKVVLSDDADKKRLIMESISLPSFQLENYAFKEHKNIIPSIEQTLNINFENYGTVMGSRMFVPLNFMNRVTNIPENVRSRKSEVFIRRSFTEVDTVTYEIPFLYKIENIPEPVKIQSLFGRYEATAEIKAEKLVYTRTLQINKGKYSPASYTDLVNFYEKIATADNLKYSLIKKY